MITNEQIAKRAYEIYLRRGGQPGHDLEDWLQAEAELKREHAAAARSQPAASGSQSALAATTSRTLYGPSGLSGPGRSATRNRKASGRVKFS